MTPIERMKFAWWYHARLYVKLKQEGSSSALCAKYECLGIARCIKIQSEYENAQQNNDLPKLSQANA